MELLKSASYEYFQAKPDYVFSHILTEFLFQQWTDFQTFIDPI